MTVLIWKKEIWPFQWRISLSWLSGFFTFNLINPIVFVLHGPVMAGRIGITFSLITAVLSIAGAWINSKIPAICSLIAENDRAKLRERLNVMYKKLSLPISINDDGDHTFIIYIEGVFA